MRDADIRPTGPDEVNSEATPSEASTAEESATESAGGTGAPEPPKETEWEEWQDRYLRLAAEFENYKKRTARDWQERVQTANADLLLDMLGVVDNFDRALLALHEESPALRGVTLIHEQMIGLLSRRGVTALKALGEKFDPEVHEAIMHLPSDDVPAGYVCTELRRGYRHHGRVLRPAQVAVSSGPRDSGDTGGAVPLDDSNEIESGVKHE